MNSYGYIADWHELQRIHNTHEFLGSTHSVSFQIPKLSGFDIAERIFPYTYMAEFGGSDNLGWVGLGGSLEWITPDVSNKNSLLAE